MLRTWLDGNGHIADVDACVAAAQSGEPDALEALIVLCARSIRSTVWRTGDFNSKHDVDDATQDALERITKTIRSYARKGGATICTWMCSVAKYRTMEFRRAAVRRYAHLGSPSPEVASQIWCKSRLTQIPHGDPTRRL